MVYAPVEPTDLQVTRPTTAEDVLFWVEGQQRKAPTGSLNTIIAAGERNRITIQRIQVQARRALRGKAIRVTTPGGNRTVAEATVLAEVLVMMPDAQAVVQATQVVAEAAVQARGPGLPVEVIR